MTSAAFCGDKSLLKFRFVNEDINPDGPIPETCEKITVYNNLDKIEYIVEKEIVFDGSHIEQIRIGRNQYFSSLYEINLTLDDEGSRIFADLTSKNIKKRLLAQIDNSYLFSAIIQMPITGGQVAISAMDNFIILTKLKENFDCIDYTGIHFDNKQFVRLSLEPDSAQTINKKDLTQVISAFLYFYQQNNPEWKTFILNSGHDDFYETLDLLESAREEEYKTIDQYNIYIEQLTKPVKVPSFLFKRQDFIDVPLLVKLENTENILIKNITLVINKKGEYYVRDF